MPKEPRNTLIDLCTRGPVFQSLLNYIEHFLKGVRVIRSKCILVAAIVLLASTSGLFGQFTGVTMSTIAQNNVGVNVHTASTGTIVIQNPVGTTLGDGTSVIDLTFDLPITNGVAGGVLTGAAVVAASDEAPVIALLGTNSARITLGGENMPIAEILTKLREF